MKFEFIGETFSRYAKTRDIRSFEKKSTCCICGEKFSGYGNNPYPVKSTNLTCCDKCNRNTVIPARLLKMNIANYNNF